MALRNIYNRVTNRVDYAFNSVLTPKMELTSCTECSFIWTQMNGIIKF